MFAPGRSQPVAAIDLACAYRGGDYWEPVDSGSWPDELDDPISAGVDGPLSSESERASPIRSDPSHYNDNEQDAEHDPEGYADRESGRAQLPESSSIGQEQFVSYQPEERYWTDYLRIALPIAGLLLLLGVFWYWASSFIGDDDENPGQSTEIAVVETPITAPTQTPTVSAAVTLPPAQTVEPTLAPTEEANANAPTPTTEPTDNGGGTEGGFANGDLVVVNDNDVNLRSDATTDSDVVTVLTNGQELSIISGEPVESGGHTWWNVQTLDGDEGWVASQFIQASGS